MRHILTAIVAAIEAVMVGLAGIAVIALPTLLVGAITFSLSIDFLTLGHVIAAVWLLAHGAGMRIELTEAQTFAFGLGVEPMGFEVSLMPLLITLGTASLAWRIGRRFSGEIATGVSAVSGASLGFAVAAGLISWLGSDYLTREIWVTVLVTSLWFVIPAWVGFFSRHPDLLSTTWFRLKVGLEQWGAPKLGWAFEPYVVRTTRLAAALVAAVVGLGALLVVAALTVGFVDVMSLTQSLQLDTLGVLSFFIGQLVFLPVFVIWAVAWVSGAGFAIGDGSSLTPFDALLGPLPAVPAFAALPEGWGTWGALAAILVVLAGLAVGVLAGRSPEYARPALWRVATVATAASLGAGLALAGLLALSTGAIGPGRLETVGPDIWVSTGLLTAELWVGVSAGLLLRRTGPAAGESLSGSAAVYDAPEYVDLTAEFGPVAEADSELVPLTAEAAASEETVDLTPLTEPHDPAEFFEVSEAPHRSDEEPLAHDDETMPADAPASPSMLARLARLPRIADPGDDDEQPWFRSAVRPRRKPAQPTFDEEELVAEYTWENDAGTDEVPSERTKRVE